MALRLTDIPRIPDALAFSDAAALSALGGAVPDLRDVSSVVATAQNLAANAPVIFETVLNRGRDIAVGLSDEVQTWINYARNAPQFFEDAAERVRSIARAALGGAGASAALSFWSGIVNTALQVQAERADANHRATMSEQKVREAAVLAYFIDYGWAVEWRSRLPHKGQTNSIRDVGAGLAPTVAGAWRASPFTFAARAAFGVPESMNTAAKLITPARTEPRCNLEQIWRARETCVVRNDAGDNHLRDALVLCTPWAWPLAVDPQWCALGAENAAQPAPDPEIWLPVAGSYVVASKAHLGLRLQPLLALREVLRDAVAFTGSGWYVGPGGLQRVLPNASWPEYGTYVSVNSWPIPTTAFAPLPEVLQAALVRMDRVLQVRRWVIEHFFELPKSWQEFGLERLDMYEPPLGYKGIKPPPKVFPGLPAGSEADKPIVLPGGG